MTAEQIVELFSDEFTEQETAGRIDNLQERLILYTDCISHAPHRILKINPVLTDVVIPFVSVDALLPIPTERTIPDVQAATLTPELIAAFLTYVAHHPDLCKADGTFKKNDCARLAKIFPGKADCLQQLLTALINLSVLQHQNKKITIDSAQLMAFAELPFEACAAYLCVAAAGNFSRSLLQEYAELFRAVIQAIPPEGYSRTTLLRLSYMIYTAQDSGFHSFQHEQFRMVSTATYTNALSQTEQCTAAHMIRNTEIVRIMFDRIIDTASDFGVLIPWRLSTHKKNDKVLFFSAPLPTGTTKIARKKAITLTGFSVTIFSGLSLSELRKLVPFLSITQYDTAPTFEITRQSVAYACDCGYDSTKIGNLLARYSSHVVPQNMYVTIEDWERAHNATALYKGYVLCLDKKNAHIFEHNPHAAQSIIKKLAPGIYVLQCTTDHAAAAVLRAAGLPAIQSKDTTVAPKTALPFLPLKNIPVAFSATSEKTDTTAPIHIEKKYTDAVPLIKKLYAALNALPLSPQKRTALRHRIERRVILSPEQLSENAVPDTLPEAHGVDFAGKLHLLENALRTRTAVIITLPDTSLSGRSTRYTGTPLVIHKKQENPSVVIRLNKTHECREFFIAQLSSVQWDTSL